MPFSGLAPSKLKIVKKKIRVGYVYIEESFDTIFNMGNRGAYRAHPPLLMRLENHTWFEGLTRKDS